MVDDEAFPVDDEELEDCELSLSCLLGRAGVFTTHTPCAALATPIHGLFHSQWRDLFYSEADTYPKKA